MVQVNVAKEDLVAAVNDSEAAVEICQTRGDDTRLAQLYDNLSTLHIMQQRHDRASEIAEKAIDLYGSMHDARREAAVHFRLSGSRQQHGLADEALSRAARAKELF